MGLPSCRSSPPRHRSPWGQPGHLGGDGEGREQLGPHTQRAWTHVPPGSAGACFEPPTSKTPAQSKKGWEKPEPRSRAKGKEKAREEQEEKASGCQELEAGFNPQPGCPETSAPARDEQRSFCAGPARERRGGGEACEAPALHRPALVPPYKGDGGPWRGGRGCWGEGSCPTRALWATTMALHGAGFPHGAGMGMREMLCRMRVWTTASAGQEVKQSTAPKANAARGMGKSQTPGVCSAAAQPDKSGGFCNLNKMCNCRQRDHSGYNTPGFRRGI